MRDPNQEAPEVCLSWTFYKYKKKRKWTLNRTNYYVVLLTIKVKLWLEEINETQLLRFIYDYIRTFRCLSLHENYPLTVRFQWRLDILRSRDLTSNAGNKQIMIITYNGNICTVQTRRWYHTSTAAKFYDNKKQTEVFRA